MASGPVAFDDIETAFAGKSDEELKKARWLFRLMGNPVIVDVGGHMARVALRIGLPVSLGAAGGGPSLVLPAARAFRIAILAEALLLVVVGHVSPIGHAAHLGGAGAGALLTGPLLCAPARRRAASAGLSGDVASAFGPSRCRRRRGRL